MGNPDAISTGPGILYHAPFGSAEPTDLVAAWPAAWTALGYTKEGSSLAHEPKTAEVTVAEELYPVKYVTEAMSSQVKFMLAEITASNLKRALNGGTITTGAGFVYFEPPAIGAEVRCMLGWQSEDTQERYVLRKCFQTGNIETSRKKGNDNALIPVEFKLEKPTGVQPWRHYFKSPERA